MSETNTKGRKASTAPPRSKYDAEKMALERLAMVKSQISDQEKSQVPVKIEGTGEDTIEPPPVKIYPEDDARSELEPKAGGYEGLKPDALKFLLEDAMRKKRAKQMPRTVGLMLGGKEK